MINLRSDTVTQPSRKMRVLISEAVVGDDAYGEDESITALESYCKELFGVEDALFSTSGMMSNRLAILSQTSPGDEVLLDYNYHINFFDSASSAAICNVVLNTRHTKDGVVTVEEVERALASKPRYYYFAQLKLVVIENTINGWVGKIFPFEQMKRLREYAFYNGIALHMDGARLFNAHVESGVSLKKYAQQVDTLSVCFSKGLSAPFGSVLMGKKDVIAKARKFRVWLGGGMHQGGFQAVAALYAIKNNILRIKDDHRKAKSLVKYLKEIDGIELHENSGETNMIQIDIRRLSVDTEKFIELCESKGVQLFYWLPGLVRAVVHSGITENDIITAYKVIEHVIRKVSC